MNNPVKDKNTICGDLRYSPLHRLSKSLLAAAFILVFSFGSASSFNPPDMDVNTGSKNIRKPLLSVENVCRSLLNPTHNTSTLAPTDEIQRKAGKLVALGVILGARFALEPTNKPKTSGEKIATAKKTDRDTNAGSIIQYRNCIKKETLALLRNSEDKKQL